MKKTTPKSLALVSTGLFLFASLVTYDAMAQQGWDPNGTTSIGGNGTWDTTTKLWTPNNTQTQVAAASLVAFTAGNTALFCAGPSGSANQGTNTITVSGAITIGGIVNGQDNPGPGTVFINGPGTLNLNSATTTIATFNPSIGFTTINAKITGVGPLAGSSTGSLIINGTNTYTGGFNVSGSGGVTYGNSAAFGTGTITWTAGGFIQPGVTTAINITNAMQHAALTETYSGNAGGVTFSGPQTLSSGATTLSTIANTVTISGAIGGTGTLTTKVASSGVGWNLNGVNTFTGNLTNTSGALSIGGAGQLHSGSYAGLIALTAGSLSYKSSAAQTLSGVISGAGTLIESGSGTLTLSGVNTYTGNTGITGGTLIISGAGKLAAAGNVTNNGVFNYNSSAAQTISGAISGTGALGVGGSGTLTLTGPNTYTGITTISSGALVVTNDANLGAVPASFVANQITLNGGSLNLNNTSADINANRGITLTANSTISAASGQSPLIESVITGPFTLTKSSAGNLTFNAANTFTGGLTITGGGARLNNNGAAGTGVITVTPASIVTIRDIAPVTNVTLTNAVVLNANTGNDIEVTAASGSSFTLSGPISGVGYLTRGRATGAGGVVVLSGSNSAWSGGLILEGGILALGSSNALGTGTLLIAPAGNNMVNLESSTPLTGANAITNIVNITMTNATLGSFFDLGGANTLELAGPVSLDSTIGSAVNITNDNSASTIISGPISSSGVGLTLLGPGTLILSGANTYTGNTTVSNGTLALGTGGLIGNSPVTVAGGTFGSVSTSATTVGASTTFNTGAKALFAAVGGVSTTAGDVSVTGDLALNNTAVTVNVSGAPLATGIYRLMDCTGNLTGTNNPAVTITGTALAAGTGATVVTATGAAGHIDLIVAVVPTFSALTTSQSIAYGTGTITLSGTLSASGPIYPAMGDTVTVTIGGNAQSTTITDAVGDFSIVYNSATVPVSASPAPIAYSYAGNNTTLAASTDTSTALTITPVPITVTAGDQTKAYGTTEGAVNTVGFSVTGLVNGELVGQVTFSYSGSPSGDLPNASVAGSPYTITPSAATGGTFNPGNFSITYSNGTLTVIPTPLAVNPNNVSAPFGASNLVLSVTYTNFVNGETLATSDVTGAPVLGTDPTTSDVGTYTVSNSIGTLTSSNYSFVLNTGTLTLTNALSTNALTATPNPALPGADVTLTSTLSALAPSAAVPTNSVQFLVDNVALGGPIFPVAGVVSITNSSLTHGTHTIEADYAGDTNAAGVTNIVASTNVVSVLINTSPVAATASYSRAAGTSLTIPVSSLLTNATDADGDTITLVSVSSPSTLGATVTTDGTNVLYTPVTNATDTFTYTVTDTFGAQSSGTITVTVTAVTPSFSALTASPSITYGTASLALSGTLSAAGPVYPASGDTVTATINGHSVNGTVTDSTGDFSIAYNDASLATDSVGGYTITYSYAGNPAAFLTAATDTSTSLTVTKAASPTVTASAQSKTYGQSIAVVGSTQFSVSGLLNGETIGTVSLAVSGTPSGDATNAPVSGSPYTITPSAATGGTFNAGNYSNISYVTGLLTVNPAPLVVTANNASRVYGTNNPAFSVTYSNFVNGETLGTSDLAGSPSLSTLATSSSPIGTYDISNSIGTLTSTNYSFVSFVDGTLTVTPLPVALTGTRPYDGTATAAFGILSIANVVGSDDVSVASGSATLAGSAAGSESIIDFTGLTLGGTNSTNYTLTGASGSVSVTTVALTITANPQSKTYGTALSLGTTAFSVGAGLVSPETVTAVTLASSGTSATAPVSGSPYTITPSAATGANGFLAANYNITYVTNSLTVNPLAVVLAGTRVYDGTTDADFSILSVADAVSGDDVNAASGSATIASASVGTNAITSTGTLALGGTTAGNYTLTGASGSVVVTNPHLPFSITSEYFDNTGTNFVVVFESIPGVVYQEYGTLDITLSRASWTAEGPTITATGTSTTNTVPSDSLGRPTYYIIKDTQ